VNKHTIGDLYQMQSLPLKAKIIMTQQRIRGWYEHFDGDVYVSFSGGKDSTVLVDIVTKMGYTDIPLVFVDTGLEYPEIREFVKGYGDRVTWLKPKLTFKQVIEKYGYPFISKEVSECVQGARKYLTSILNEQNALTDRQTDRQTDLPYRYWYDRVTGQGKYQKKRNTPSVDEIALNTASRGGYDRKYRRIRGIGEFARRTAKTAQGRFKSATSDNVGDVDERTNDKGEYP